MAFLTLVAGGLWLEDLEARVVNKRVSGVIESVGQLHGVKTRTMEIGLSVEVKLDDGRLAKVMALRTAEPHVGDRVEITEQIHGTGRHNFVWN